MNGIEISGFRGGVIAAEQGDYEHVRAVWNGPVDRRPRLIARCTGAADAAATVRFAQDRGYVRGGCHHVAGTAVCDDGIVIDLSAMRTVSVDPIARSALSAVKAAYDPEKFFQVNQDIAPAKGR
jgi:FAD/FMN-containing dehydrogenase